MLKNKKCQMLFVTASVVMNFGVLINEVNGGINRPFPIKIGDDGKIYKDLDTFRARWFNYNNSCDRVMSGTEQRITPEQMKKISDVLAPITGRYYDMPSSSQHQNVNGYEYGQQFTENLLKYILGLAAFLKVNKHKEALEMLYSIGNSVSGYIIIPEKNGGMDSSALLNRNFIDFVQTYTNNFFKIPLRDKMDDGAKCHYFYHYLPVRPIEIFIYNHVFADKNLEALAKKRFNELFGKNQNH